MNEPASRQAAGGQARGIMVGSLFALGWWVYGVAAFATGVRVLLVAAALVLTLALIVASTRIIQRVRMMPLAAAAEIAGSKRAWRWFWLNLIGEIVLLNLAVSLLDAPDLRIYWIAAISGVVGLHFLPMAIFFRARSYWFVGIAMMVGAAASALLLSRSFALATDIVHSEGLANAMILWSSLCLAALRHRLASSRID